jgi:hypothetical protein
MDHSIALQVSSRFPTAAAPVRSGHVGFVVNEAENGADFLRVLPLPLPVLIPQTVPRSLIILSSKAIYEFSVDTDTVLK